MAIQIWVAIKKSASSYENSCFKSFLQCSIKIRVNRCNPWRQNKIIPK